MNEVYRYCNLYRELVTRPLALTRSDPGTVPVERCCETWGGYVTWLEYLLSHTLLFVFLFLFLFFVFRFCFFVVVFSNVTSTEIVLNDPASVWVSVVVI